MVVSLTWQKWLQGPLIGYSPGLKKLFPRQSCKKCTPTILFMRLYSCNHNRGAPSRSENVMQRFRRIYVRWEVTPILALTIFTLGFASYRFYSMAKEPDSQWTRVKDENEWLKKLEAMRPKKEQ